MTSGVKKIAAGGKESEEVRVDKACLEGQSMVVMGEQRFFFFDTHVSLTAPQLSLRL